MELPPDIEFHQDIRLLIYRPRGLINEAALNKVINIIEELYCCSLCPVACLTDSRFFDQGAGIPGPQGSRAMVRRPD